MLKENLACLLVVSCLVSVLGFKNTLADPVKKGAPVARSVQDRKPAAQKPKSNNVEKEQSQPVSSVQSVAQFVARHGAWGSYAYQDKGEKVCYVLSVPQKVSPSSFAKKENFFLVRLKYDKNKKLFYEPQFMSSVALDPASSVFVTVAGKEFEFFAKQGTAWLKSRQQEKKFISLMQKGLALQVDGKTKAGAIISCTYSLVGFNASLKNAALTYR